MDLATPSDPSMAEKPSSLSAPAAAPSSPSNTGFLGEIETPEKKDPAPHRAINRNMAFSIKDVQRFSQRLRARDGHGVADRAGTGPGGDELSFPEEKLVSGSPSKTPNTKPLVKLPEKYEALVEFFNCMETSIRLLRLKGSITTFSSISSSIQHMTERRFTHKHLAQLKFIFPESISINKVAVRDEASCCMKPELQVFMRTDAAGDKKRKGESPFTSLRRVFRERLADFSKEHPEEYDVPEDTLPHPFGRTISSIQSSLSRTSQGSTSVESAVSNIQDLQLAASSHMPQSFKRRFSQKIPLDNVDNARASTDSSPDYVASPVKCTSRAPISVKSRLCPPVPPPVSCLSPKCLEEKAEAYSKTDGGSSEGLLFSESTPAKPVSTPLRLMTETPELRAEKRFLPSSSYDTPPDHNTGPARKKMKRSVRAKLSLSPEKSSKKDEQVMEVEDHVSILPSRLLQSIREKEIIALADKEPSAAEARRRQKIVARLPETFDAILLLFQSGNRSVVTKKELIHKIIAGHLKIVDKGEIEEQLKLLQEIAPDWIWMKTTMNGDPLFCVDKRCNADEIRRKIVDSGRRNHLDIC